MQEKAVPQKDYVDKSLGHYKDGYNMVSHMNFGEADKDPMTRNYVKGAAVDSSITRQKNSTEERPNPMRAAMMD